MISSVREVQHTICIDIEDAPAVPVAGGRHHKPRGLRISYGRRRDIDRVDLIVEFHGFAQLWPPSQPLPNWLADLVEVHRPTDVDDPQENRRPGLGGLSVRKEEE